mgnify:CR=1 FL=1
MDQMVDSKVEKEGLLVGLQVVREVLLEDPVAHLVETEVR